MTDLALDPIGRDMVFGSVGGHATLLPIDGPAQVAQAVGIHLRAWLGEWFLDVTYGVPYLESILGKNRRAAVIEAILRAQILSVAGVTGIEAFRLTIDPQARTLRVDFTAATADGPASGTVSL